jgi:hypothetical protein
MKGTSFSSEIPPIRQRLICNVEGLEKTGKTHFASFAPGPIAFLDLDRGSEGPVNRAKESGQKFLYAKYRFQSLVVPGNEKATAEKLRPLWAQLKTDYKAALESKTVRTIVIDTGYAAWELIKTARFGRFERIPPILTAQVNAEFSRLITMAQDFDKSVLWLHRLFPEWANKPNPSGKGDIGYKTGNVERRGFKDLAFDVQANIRLGRTPEGRFTATIIDSRLNHEVSGLTLKGANATFANIAAMIYGNSPEEWI